MLYDCADVDDQGQLWISSGGQKWYKIDLSAMVISAAGSKTSSMQLMIGHMYLAVATICTPW